MTLRKYATKHQGTFEYEKVTSKTELCCKSSKIFVRLARHFETLKDTNTGGGQDSDTEMKSSSIQDLWKLLFSELKHLFYEVQYSLTIRKSTLEALQEILSNCSSKLT